MKMKKFLSTISAICLAMSIPITASAASTVRGDANGDNKLDVRDAAHIAKCLVKGLTMDPMADFNLDGVINIRDAAAISANLTTVKATSKEQSASSIEEEILNLVNIERKKAGVAPLKLNPTLNAAASVRAVEITNVFSHTRPNGKSCFSIFDENNISFSFCGENIAAGGRTAAETVEQWVNSPGHYANMISPNYNELGVGLCYDKNSKYGYYWVQIFRQP